MKDTNNPSPQTPRSGKPADSNFNWGFVILLILIIGTIGFSFFGNSSSPFSSKKLTLNEFEKAYKEGHIVLNNPKKAPLKVWISDETSSATIEGTLIEPTDKTPDTGIQTENKKFVSIFNTIALTDKLKEKLIEAGAQIKTTLTMPEIGNVDRISLEQVNNLLGQAAILSSAKTPLTLYINGDNAYLDGTYIKRTWPETAEKGKAAHQGFQVPFNAQFERTRVQDLLGKSAEFDTKSSSFLRIFIQFLPILIVLLIIFFIFKNQMKSAGKTAMNFGKSRARMLDNSKKKITFKDVAGVTEAKEEVWEIVDFLRDPEKFQKLGGVIPKGILMVGPPGTGKTLIARAIAGEADVPFFSISGSDFVEMFVGVGASRVRDMFEQAKKNAPCLIFIDEIDAVGRHRGHGVGGGHDEREQTLNALLVEMDGFDANENVIVIAATNRPDVLDPALLRPGRFDRQVVVSLPDVKGREEILKVHAKKVKMGKDIDLSIIARGTAGFSGAKLANLINEAALLAVRRGKDEITQSELEESRDKVGWGKERRSMAISEKEKKTTAYHEAGHAICLLKCEHTEPLHKVTIIPRGPSLGSTMWLPSEDKFTGHYNEFIDQIVVAMGGRCAEEIIFGDITSGASGDIRMATRIARSMVCEYGMSKALGVVEYGENSGEVFLARDINRSKNFSEKTAELIDEEIRRITNEGYLRSLQILTENKDKLDLIAQALLEYETLDGKQVQQILERGSFEKSTNEDLPPALPDDGIILSPAETDLLSDKKDDGNEPPPLNL